jgi:monoamine oxidase
VQKGSRLVLLERTGAGAAAPLRLTIARNGETRTLTARHVILALPPRSIDLLDQRTFLFDHAQFRADLRAVAGIPVSRIFLAFDRPWWAPLGIRAGVSATDLPLKQCLYFGSERDQPGGDPSNQRSLLLGAYVLGLSSAYWEDFLINPPAAGALDPYPTSGHVPADVVAPLKLVRANQAQLAELHGLPVPDPYWAAYMNWARDPFGGGVHFWRTGTKSWEIMPRIRRPLADANVYVCGEAWCGQQGWVEGALQTTERVLEDHLQLPRPAWLAANADLGD